MKKILLLTQFFFPDRTGTGKILSELCHELVKNDFAIDVAASRQEFGRKNAQLLDSFQVWHNIRIFRSCSLFGDKNKTFGRIYNYLAVFVCTFITCWSKCLFKEKDIILSVSNPPIMPLLGVLLKHPKQKFFYIVHDLYPDIAIAMGVVSRKHLFSRVMFAVNNYVFKHADGVIVLGRDMARYLQDNYYIPAEKIHIFPNWGNDSLLSIDNDADTGRKLRIVYSGNMGRFHNLELAAEAVKDMPDVELFFVGEGQAKKDLMAGYGKYENIKFLTYMPDDEYIDMLTSADALLVSLEEKLSGLAVPSKFYTYLAAGRPIICISDEDTEMAMTIRENNCGYIVEHGNLQQFVMCCESLSKDKNKKTQLGNNARRMFLDRYRLKHVMKKYVELFDK